MSSWPSGQVWISRGLGFSFTGLNQPGQGSSNQFNGYKRLQRFFNLPLCFAICLCIFNFAIFGRFLDFSKFVDVLEFN